MNSDLKPEYHDVRFRCSGLDLPPVFFVITAHNPDGTTVDDATNQQADQRLRAEIAHLGYESFR